MRNLTSQTSTGSMLLWELNPAQDARKAAAKDAATGGEAIEIADVVVVAGRAEADTVAMADTGAVAGTEEDNQFPPVVSKSQGRSECGPLSFRGVRLPSLAWRKRSA